MGFYRLHLLEIVTVEFLIVPLLMVVGGTFAFFTAVFGFYAASKEDACLLITHAVFMTINFCILLAAIISSVRLIFYIQTGLFEANVTEDMNMYEINSWVRYRWDTLQCKYSFCIVLLTKFFFTLGTLRLNFFQKNNDFSLRGETV